MSTRKILSKETLFQNPYRLVEKWNYEKSDGVHIDLTMVGGDDVAIVAAITPEKKFLIIQDFFPNKLQKFPSLVAGHIDTGESPIEAAARELKEETGYVARTIVPLGSSFAGKYFNFTIHYFLAEDVVVSSHQSLEVGEDIDVSIVTREEFEELADSTRLQCVFDLACAYRALAYIKKSGGIE